MVKKVNMTIEESVLARIDKYAEMIGLNRSQFVSLACSKYIDAEEKVPNMQNVLNEFFRLTGKAMAGDMSPDQYRMSLDVLQSEVDACRE